MARKPKPDSEAVDHLTRVTDYDEGLVKTLATVGSKVNIPSGWSIIMETTPADSAYIVLDGTVEVRKGGETLAELGPGDVFGEIALVNHRLRNASVVTVTPVTALRLDQSAVAALIEQDSGFADTLRATVDKRLES